MMTGDGAMSATHFLNALGFQRPDVVVRHSGDIPPAGFTSVKGNTEQVKQSVCVPCSELMKDKVPTWVRRDDSLNTGD